MDKGPVFTSSDGRPIQPVTLTRHFNALLCRSRLRTIRFHDLRHPTATLLLEHGFELVVIKDLGVTPTSRHRRRSMPTSDSCSSVTPSISSVTRCATPKPPPSRTTATTGSSVQRQSAGVAINYCRHSH
ncbi:tyrosine-type recombinase/integrase [Amycolatopsis sp. NPDC001319]|uniref:tyrosine-type recombinase/integrase n=1 Tax=unclassified Amycolatopsis TaxID=2618356 RepID=UPI0036A9A9C6